MQEVIDKVRSRVLQLVSQADDQLLDPHDVDSHVRTRDAFIRMFCEHYRVNHSDKDYDIESISQKMLKTLKWRKATGLTTMTTEDIPVEFWNTKALLIHEDDEYVISVYLLKRHHVISKRWRELCITYHEIIQDRIFLEAAHAGKTLIAITDARQAGISNADYPFFDTSMKHSDEHFPCLFHRTGMFGIPRLIVPLVQWFLKWSMPTAFRNRFQFLHEDNIVSFFGKDRLPEELGGKLHLRDPVDLTASHLKSVKDHGKDWGLDVDEVRKILQLQTL